MTETNLSALTDDNGKLTEVRVTVNPIHSFDKAIPLARFVKECAEILARAPDATIEFVEDDFGEDGSYTALEIVYFRPPTDDEKRDGVPVT